MKRELSFVIMIIISLSVYGQLGYRYKDSFINLFPDNSLYYYIQTLTGERMDNLISESKNGRGEIQFVYRLSEKECIVQGSEIRSDDYVSEIFCNDLGEKIIILPRLAIKLKRNHNIDDILKSFNGVLRLDKVNLGLFIVNCNKKNAEDILKLNAKLNDMPSVEWSEPMMIGEGRPSNTLYSSQYYLKNTGQSGGTSGIDINVEPAWKSVTVNTNLIVAVLDDGVERTHEDLSGSVLDGMTFFYPNEKGDPINAYNNYYLNGNNYESDGKCHGTSCAGIIGAKNNNIGIRGVASGVKLLPINIYPYSYPISVSFFNSLLWYETIADAIQWAYETKHADIINCSWVFSNSSYIENAMIHATEYGRNGKGTIISCSSGNSYDTQKPVRFPASLDCTIAVGAVNKFGVVCGYSCRGSSLDLVAPSSDTYDGDGTGGIVTTTRSGYGESLSNYTKVFGGTSATAPQVSGVIALMLSEYPDLTCSEIKKILELSCRKLPAMNGLNRTDAYGYGLLDASSAVNLARKWKQSRQCTLSGNSLVCNHINYTLTGLPSGVDVTWRFSSQTSNSPALYINEDQSCYVSAYPENSFSGTLYADVKIQGELVKTYSKTIEGGGTYFIAYYMINDHNMDVLWGDDNWAAPGDLITVMSSDFSGKSAKYSRSSSPSNYTTLTVSNNQVSFYMPALSSGESLTLWISGGCTNRSYTFYRSTLSTNSNNLLSVTLQDETHYLLSLASETGDDCIEQNEQLLEKNSEELLWVFRVYNAVNLQQVTTEVVKGDSFVIDTSSWKPGVYIIRAYIDNKPYTTKITVK